MYVDNSFNNSTQSYITHLLRTYIKVQKGHTKVNAKLVRDCDVENTFVED